jgi:hypothetical protein
MVILLSNWNAKSETNTEHMRIYCMLQAAVSSDLQTDCESDSKMMPAKNPLRIPSHTLLQEGSLRFEGYIKSEVCIAPHVAFRRARAALEDGFPHFGFEQTWPPTCSCSRDEDLGLPPQSWPQ